MPAPAETLQTLARLFPPDSILTAVEDLIPYSFDGTAAIQQMPLAVVFAKTTGQVSDAVRLANEQGWTIVTRGSGTGLSGGSVPSEGCVV